MRKVLIFAAMFLAGCQSVSQPHIPHVYTTPGSDGGVSKTVITVTPLKEGH